MKDLRDDLSRFELLAGIGAENSGLSSLNLNHFNGVDIGIRNFKRDMPLETEAVNGVKVPAKAEMCRIKGWLVITRNGVNEYADFVSFCDSMSPDEIIEALSKFDDCYPQPERSEKALFQLIRMLSDPKPYDLTDERRRNVPCSWEYVLERCQRIADIMFDNLMLKGKETAKNGEPKTEHRHVDDDFNMTPPGIEDVILRGSFEDAKELARRIAKDPFGETAQALERILKAVPEELGSYGIVWSRFLKRARTKNIYVRLKKSDMDKPAKFKGETDKAET